MPNNNRPTTEKSRIRELELLRPPDHEAPAEIDESLNEWLRQADPIQGWPLDERAARLENRVMLAIEALTPPLVEISRRNP